MPMGKFYRLSSIVLCEMTLIENNVPLVTFKSHTIDGYELSADSMKTLIREASTGSLPVVFRVGAIDYRIGTISTIRIGRDEAFADIRLSLKGEFEFKPIYDDEKKVIGVKASKFVYKKVH